MPTTADPSLTETTSTLSDRKTYRDPIATAVDASTTHTLSTKRSSRTVASGPGVVDEGVGGAGVCLVPTGRVGRVSHAVVSARAAAVLCVSMPATSSIRTGWRKDEVMTRLCNEPPADRYPPPVPGTRYPVPVTRDP